jgi:hypothetical protein
MLKKLTAHTVNQEKKDVIERTANLCDFRSCRFTCGPTKEVLVETSKAIFASGFLF